MIPITFVITRVLKCGRGGQKSKSDITMEAESEKCYVADFEDGGSQEMQVVSGS